ncbi:hypothetical protein ADU76_02350 (plasmid) [Clostridium botulinum]|uniref:hypothetical protein n=1 Tax=Clostridium botulinum TaxID=1491 RepID=UPI0004D9244A|nr:hypothetical protein [Clostridium botulinum]KEH96568.1 hypothetical protein Z953_p0148 [Clostridium botulinum D str. 16868]KOA94860.1 hypothetical protein ADU76_02350 [Clostridium botulinum]
MKEQLLNEIIKCIFAIVIMLVGQLTLQIQSFIKKKKALAIQQGKAEVYNNATYMAEGVYTLLEHNFKDLKKSGEAKKNEMDRILKSHFPSLTDEELDVINKQVWNKLNDNVIKELKTPIVITKEEVTE